jgi:hypothetical protein
MRNVLALIIIIALLPITASAQNVGQCGWGSKVFHGQKGIVPQVFAVTTNGTSGNQTFGITSGTSGCTQNGVVKSSWQTAAFVNENMTKFARDISRGSGESLEAFASLLSVSTEDKELFAKVLQENFSAIFPTTEVDSLHVLTSVRSLLAANERLSNYAPKV